MHKFQELAPLRLLCRSRARLVDAEKEFALYRSHPRQTEGVDDPTQLTTKN